MVTLPLNAGIGLRAPHHDPIMERRPAVGWLEAHAENYLGAGPARRTLERLRADYPISLHSVGLSFGSAEGLDIGHLDRIAELVAAIEPAAVSDHLSWSVCEGVYLADLLPLPLSEETLAAVAANVLRAQDRLGRPLLIENPSAYVAFRHSPIPEPEFLAELARQTECGILLDINNLYVSARNLGFDPEAALNAYPEAIIGEIHLAGHAIKQIGEIELRIDDHGSPVQDPVWGLFERALKRIGPRPTLIEWDSALPSLEVLVGQAELAELRLAHVAKEAAA
ncbi:MAG TPA: DUF692 domain-containing protein [Alphaproteobacteria bacterium]|nr:DUF692 domain-containing protein [Alphaproteobacteria bacterium]